MTTVERPAPAPMRISQATAIEQSRAVAEVQAAIVVAQQCPRDVTRALREVEESCRQKSLAEKAFYRFPRGRTSVTGESIELARELARVWGNIQHGIAELSRDDAAGQSEMVAFAWDVQTNARVSNTFIAPHRRDKTGGTEALVDLRDIYENNANLGARRVRECIFAVLPPWLKERAKELCHQTLATDGNSGKPLAVRVADAVKAFEGLGIVQAQLETKLGRPAASWLDLDVAQLQVIFRSIQRGEVSKADEFPAEQSTERVTVAEITEQAAPTPAASEGEAEQLWPETPKPGTGKAAPKRGQS